MRGEDTLRLSSRVLISGENYIFAIALRYAREERKLLKQSNPLAHYGPRIEAFVRIQPANLHCSRTRGPDSLGSFFAQLGTAICSRAAAQVLD